MSGNHDQFVAFSRDLGRVVAGHNRPLTFVLGAGASLSSGAPSTPQVHERFAAITDGRFDGRIRERFHELRRPEIRDLLRPLFAEVVPDVGYRILVSLARERRINVVSLNWDDAVEKACASVGVDFASFDPLVEPDHATKAAELPADRGVLIVHAHGTVGEDPRYGVRDTLPDHSEIWAAIAPLLEHEKIICGASLQGDLDVSYVIERLDNDDRDGAATWLFLRPGGEEPPIAIPNAWTKVEFEQVDFDDLMVILAEEVHSASGRRFARWDDVVGAFSYLELPRSMELVELRPEVRREAIGAQVAAFVASPYSGKTVAVLRLAHLRLLIDGVDELHVSVEPQDSPVELSISAKRGDVIVVVDDPFGSGEPEMNPLVGDFLARMCDGGLGYSAVCSPTDNWEAGSDGLDDGLPGLYISPRYAGDWYERPRLARLADRREHRSAALRRIHDGSIVSPPEVMEVGRTGQEVDAKRLVEDKARRLERDPALGLLCALVRLQERAGGPFPPEQMAAILGCEPVAVAGSDGLLTVRHLGRVEFLAFNHSTSGIAADNYIAAHFAQIRARLEEARVLPEWIDRCLAGWALANRHELAADDPLRDAQKNLEPADWFAERLGSRPTEETLRSLDLSTRDEWATVDLAYEVVRFWGSIGQLESGRRLLRDLVDRPMGLYGLLEGCLYFGIDGNYELWSRLLGHVYATSDDPARSFERLLIVDAVVWREPSHEPLRAWAAETVKALAPTSPEFAIVRFAAGYHGPGLSRLDIRKPLAEDGRRSWAPEQAAVGARLVAWHFAHQSRARVLLHRRSNIDKDWLCQEMGESKTGEYDPEAQLRLVSSLADHADTAGWGFHVACNLAVVAGLSLDEDSSREAALEALVKAPSDDPGVLSAVLAYRSADLFRRHLRERFGDERKLKLVLAAMGSGIDVPGAHVKPPRFRFVHKPTEIYRTLDCHLPKIDAALPLEPVELASGLWRAAAAVLETRDREVKLAISVKIEEVRRGDLRPLEPQTRLQEPVGEPFTDAVLGMIQDWFSEKEQLI